MDKKAEALKLALEALEAAEKHHTTTSLPQAIKNYGSRDAHAKAGFETWLTIVPHAITAIREALAEQPAQQQEKAPPEQWRERWYGSLAEKGWWICCGREHIAHLGTEVSSDEVRKIVDAHNRYKPAALQKEPAQQQPDEVTVWKARAMQAEAVIAKFMDQPAQQQEPDRVKFERHWRKTRGDKKANRELPRHPLQPQTYIQDSANRHWVTWQTAVRSVAPTAQRNPLTHEQRVDLLAKFEAHKHEWHAPAILIDMVEAAHGITGEKK